MDASADIIRNAASVALMIVVDGRWDGAHGIGRYAREVLLRLDTPWRPLRMSGRPASSLDPLRPRRLRRGDLLYSPGYNPACLVPRQVITIHDLIHLHESRVRPQY